MKGVKLYTGSEGEGRGQILFVEGNPESPIVTPDPVKNRNAEPPASIKGKWESGRLTNWGDYESEIATRDEGARGLPLTHHVLDRYPAHVRAELAEKGVVDHKEWTARRMMEALHSGDAAYFDGLAKVLRKHNRVRGGRWPELSDKHQEIVDAIRIAAMEERSAPRCDQVLEALGWNSGRPEFQDPYPLEKLIANHLEPLGFGWLPRRSPGRPQNSP